MFCGQCGTKMKAENKFCTKCGKKSTKPAPVPLENVQEPMPSVSQQEVEQKTAPVPQPESKENNKKLIGIIGGALAVLVVIVGIALFLISRTDYVQVPDFTGLNVNEAVELIEEFGLTLGEITEEYNDRVDEGLVISQSLRSGREVERGATINLVISLGEEVIEVIEVIEDIDDMELEEEELNEDDSGEINNEHPEDDQALPLIDDGPSPLLTLAGEEFDRAIQSIEDDASLSAEEKDERKWLLVDVVEIMGGSVMWIETPAGLNVMGRILYFNPVLINIGLVSYQLEIEPEEVMVIAMDPDHPDWSLVLALFISQVSEERAEYMARLEALYTQHFDLIWDRYGDDFPAITPETPVLELHIRIMQNLVSWEIEAR